MAPRKVHTRNSSAAWLIGHEAVSISEDGRLPTLQQVLQHVIFLQKLPKMTTRGACVQAIDSLLELWETAGIPTVVKKAALFHLLRRYNEWQLLKKSCMKKTNVKRERFTKLLGKLFDISAPNVESNKAISAESLAYYQLLKKGDRCAAPKKKFTFKKITEKKEVQQCKLKVRASRDSMRLSEKVFFSSGSETDDVTDKKDPEFQIPISKQERTKRKTLKVLSSDVTAALDRTQTSGKFGSHLVKQVVRSTLQTAAEVLGIEADIKPVFSTSSVKRSRIENRVSIVSEVKENISKYPGKLFVHWDGKLLPDEPDGKKYDRLPVLVTGYDVEQLLGVPRLDHGTGLSEATATFQLLKSWELQEKVVGLVFDTPSTNTGCNKGCCKLLQDMLGKELLWCACRHHVMELQLEAAATELLGDSNDPRLPFFGALVESWEKLDKEKYRTLSSVRKLAQTPEHKDIIKFCTEQLQVKQPRGDYRELSELSILFLGGVIPGKEEYTFKKPGALSKTRWMMRAIYAIKTWMFGRQLKLDSSVDAKLLKLSVFVCRCYVRMWFNAPLAPQAPRNDLLALQFLYKNRNLGSHWKAACNKLANHLWYLSPKIIPLALFDDNVALDEKRAIVDAILSPNAASELEGPVAVRAEVKLDKSVLQLRLRDFASPQCLKFFEATGVSTNILRMNPELWASNVDYQEGLKLVTHFRVVNDAAERAVQLATRLMKGNQLTRDEDERQLLLIVMAEDRKKNKL